MKPNDRFPLQHPGPKLDIRNGQDLSERFQNAHANDFSLLNRPDVEFLETRLNKVDDNFYDFTLFSARE